MNDLAPMEGEVERPQFDAAAALHAMSDGFFAVDGDWRVQFVSQQAVQWLGVPSQEVIGRSLWAVAPGLRGTELETRARKVMRTRSAETLTAPSVVRAGAQLDVRIFPFQQGLGVTFRDVTGRIALEEALRTGASEVRQLTDALPLLVSYVDREGRFQFNNLAYEQWSGRSREELKGCRVRDVVGEANHARVAPYIARALAGERVTFEWKGRRLRGQAEGDFRSDYIPRMDEAGRPDGFYVLFTDITEHKATERRLAQLNLDLESAVEERTAALTQALAQLREEMQERQRAEAALAEAQKMEAVGQLTGGMAHDFNNLLTVIQSSTDLLRRRIDDPQRRDRYLDAIGEAAERAANLTQQLLVFARRQPVQAEVFDIGARTVALSRLIRSTLGARYAVEVRVDGGPYRVEADRNQYETALLNMALNARDAMAAGGRLTITVGSAASSAVVVEVADTGPGIDEETQRRIFEPFFTTKEVGRGTGLGLSQVYGFARQSGGDISVMSVVGEGATFSLSLPLTEKPCRADSDGPAAAEASHLAGRILLVEDNPLVREFATSLLEHLGWSVTSAEDAAAALGLFDAEAGGFEMVLTDVVMPGELTGLDLAREIRRRKPRAAVLLASGYSEVLLDEGDLGFPLLQKPYALEKLAKALADARALIA